MRFRLLSHRRFTLFVGVLLWCWISFSIESIGAQSAVEPQWYYGYREAPISEFEIVIAKTYDIIAYTLNGQVAPIVEGLGDLPRVFYLDKNHVLVISEKNDKPVYFEIKGIEVTLLEIKSDNPAISNAYMPISYRAPYLLLSSGGMGARLIIADLENDRVDLAGKTAIIEFSYCCVLKEDGRLQYFAQLEGGERVFGLVERDLATGVERTLFTDPDLQSGTVNASGNRWLLQINTPDTRERLEIFWQGDTEQSRQTLPLSQRTIWLGDIIYRDNVLCEADCEITLEAPDGERTTITTNFPDTGEGANRLFFPYRLLADGSLIGRLRDPDQIAKITPEGEFTIFDYLNIEMSINGIVPVFSRDWRFALVGSLLDGQGYAVVNTETGSAVIESGSENALTFISALFYREGVLVSAYGEPNIFQFYRASDQKLFDLPTENVKYFDVLDNDTLLYSSADATIHIGLYQLETSEMQVAVEGIFPLYARSAVR
jgi:hypothetical protein